MDFFQFSEAFGSVRPILEGQRLPFVPDEAQGRFHRAGYHIVRWFPFNRYYSIMKRLLYKTALLS